MKEIRIEKIMNILKQRGFATVDELARATGVSKITVRRYLDFLKKQGLIIRRRGGAFLKNIHYDTPFFSKLEDRKDEKMRIAEKVIEVLRDNQVIFATGGTTVYYAIQALDNSPFHNLTILTNSITTAWAVINLYKSITLIHTGGLVREGSFECIGGHVIDFVNNFNIDVFL
ncbi:DeoR/GlpR family DNA-binding transcription regulator, partial [Thermotoga sp.]|uniref:DeoR/GlpR family DNA-binding transcription regulator n=1 Tax=Thermotoga sp. TaxID=28240 RepID=UPI0025D340CC